MTRLPPPADTGTPPALDDPTPASGFGRYASEEQVVYARWLSWGTLVGFVLLFAGLIAYVGGVLEPIVPLEDSSRYWGLSAAEYRATVGVDAGWGWVRHVGRGDYVPFVGIATLSLVTVACYLRLLPILLNKGDRVAAGICVLEIVVLLLAASGLLAVGH